MEPSELYRQRSPVRYIRSEWVFIGSRSLRFIQTGRSKNDAAVFSLLLIYPRDTTRPSTTSSPTPPIGVSLSIFFGSSSQLRPPTAVPIVAQSEFKIRPVSSDLTPMVAIIDVSLGPTQNYPLTLLGKLLLLPYALMRRQCLPQVDTNDGVWASPAVTNVFRSGTS
jgi:hypothetical protein